MKKEINKENDKDVSEFESTNIKNKLAIISPVEIKENTLTKRYDCKRKIYFENEDEVELKEINNNDTKIGSNKKEILSLKNKGDKGEDDNDDDGFYCTNKGNNKKININY